MQTLHGLVHETDSTFDIQLVPYKQLVGVCLSKLSDLQKVFCNSYIIFVALRR
jgi:hypothetical protein